MSENSSRYRTLKECKIHVSNFDVDKRFFKRVYTMSQKWGGLNQIVINLDRYMKVHMNYVCRCAEMTDKKLKYFSKSWKNLKSLRSFELDLPQYETIH